MSATRQTGTELYWIDGEPIAGLPNPPTANNIGTELYWIDGQPMLQLFPASNLGNFFLVFF